MSDIKNEPSQLYDADFKKDEKDAGADEFEDIYSSSDIQRDIEDLPKEGGGFFSKRRAKRKERKKAKRDADDGYDIFDLQEIDPDAYSFAASVDENAPDGEQNSQAEELPPAVDNLDEFGYPQGEINQENAPDINELLKSIGIEPISHVSDETDTVKQDDTVETEDVENASEEPVADDKTREIDIEQIKQADTTETIVADEKTKSFTVPSDVITDVAENTNSNDDEIEAQLKQSRRSLIDNFRVLAKEISDKTLLERKTSPEKTNIADNVKPQKGQSVFDAVEKTSRKKRFEQIIKPMQPRPAIKGESITAAETKKKKQQLRTQAGVLLGLIGLTVVLAILAMAYKPDGALEPLFRQGARIYTAISLIVLAAGAIVSRKMFIDAFSAAKNRRINGSTAVAFIGLIVAVHHIVCLITGLDISNGMTLYTMCALFAMFSQTAGMLFKLDAITDGFSLMRKSSVLTGLNPLSDKDADTVAHGINNKGKPKIFLSVNKAAADSLEYSTFSAFEENFYRLTFVVALGLSLIFAIVFAVISKSFGMFVQTFTSSVCLLMPVTFSIVLGLMLKRINSGASAVQCATANIDSCIQLGKSDGVIFGARDIFDCAVYKFKAVPGCGVLVQDAAIYAAVTLKKTDCILADCFDDFLAQIEFTLPDAQDVTYEEQLGFCSWVAGSRVLVGNRQMLVSHSIDCPSQQEEEQYGKGNKVMYVVVDGRIIATFLVSYSARPQVRKNISAFVRSGHVLMLSTNEPCLSESYVAERIKTDVAAVKILSSNAAEIIAVNKAQNQGEQVQGLMCSEKQRNLFYLVTSAFNFSSKSKLLTVISFAAMAFCLAIEILFTAMQITPGLSAVAVVILHLLWSAGEVLPLCGKK